MRIHGHTLLLTSILNTMQAINHVFVLHAQHFQYWGGHQSQLIDDHPVIGVYATHEAAAHDAKECTKPWTESGRYDVRTYRTDGRRINVWSIERDKRPLVQYVITDTPIRPA